MTPIKDILTGPDNVTFAIGRVLGVLLFVNLVLFFPLLVGGVFLFAKPPVEPQVWFSFMDKLLLYVPAMALACWGLIKGTNSIEEDPK